MTSLLSGFVSCVKSDSIKTVSPSEFQQGIDNQDVQVVDVRSISEYESGHIDGAENVDVESADFLGVARQALSKDKPVYVYCRSGRRSLEAANQLAKIGYEVVNLDGGIINWESEGMPVIEGGQTK